MFDPTRDSPRRSLFALIADVPGLLIDLVKAELRQLKDELVRKLTNAGIGLAMFVVAGLFGFFALGVLIATAILALALVLPPWLAALIIGVLLLLIAGVFAWVGVSRLRRGLPPAPTETIRSVKSDLRVIKGQGRR